MAQRYFDTIRCLPDLGGLTRLHRPGVELVVKLPCPPPSIGSRVGLIAGSTLYIGKLRSWTPCKEPQYYKVNILTDFGGIVSLYEVMSEKFEVKFL